MQVTIKLDCGTECTVSNDGVTFEDLFDLLKQACVGVGFHPVTVKEWFDEN